MVAGILSSPTGKGYRKKSTDKSGGRADASQYPGKNRAKKRNIKNVKFSEQKN